MGRHDNDVMPRTLYHLANALIQNGHERRQQEQCKVLCLAYKHFGTRPFGKKASIFRIILHSNV